MKCVLDFSWLKHEMWRAPIRMIGRQPSKNTNDQAEVFHVKQERLREWALENISRLRFEEKNCRDDGLLKRDDDGHGSCARWSLCALD